jgi:hypothetical protein
VPGPFRITRGYGDAVSTVGQVCDEP